MGCCASTVDGDEASRRRDDGSNLLSNRPNASALIPSQNPPVFVPCEPDKLRIPDPSNPPAVLNDDLSNSKATPTTEANVPPPSTNQAAVAGNPCDSITLPATVANSNVRPCGYIQRPVDNTTTAIASVNANLLVSAPVGADDDAPIEEGFQGDPELPINVACLDMPCEQFDQILKVCKCLVQKHSVEVVLAREIKKTLDKMYGPVWMVVVGGNFGTYVTYQQCRFAHFYIGNTAIVLFRSLTMD